MIENYKVGDKVWYKTVLGAVIMAKVVEVHNAGTPDIRYTLEVTSRSNKVFYRGYTFTTNKIHVWGRK